MLQISKKTLQKKYSNSAISTALVGVEGSGMVELTIRSARWVGSPRLFEVRAQKTGIAFQIPSNTVELAPGEMETAELMLVCLFVFFPPEGYNSILLFCTQPYLGVGAAGVTCRPSQLLHFAYIIPIIKLYYRTSY